MNPFDILVRLIGAVLLSGLLVWAIDETPLAPLPKSWAKAILLLTIGLALSHNLGLI